MSTTQRLLSAAGSRARRELATWVFLPGQQVLSVAALSCSTLAAAVAEAEAEVKPLRRAALAEHQSRSRRQ
jgi:hypothetical protein